MRHSAHGSPQLETKNGGRSALEEVTERARTRARALNFRGEGVGQGGILTGLEAVSVALMPGPAKFPVINLIDKLTL